MPGLQAPFFSLLWLPAVGPGLRVALRWAAQHTGLPVLVVAAIALVVSFRLVKKSVRLVFEVAVATALLVAATRLGWIRW
jgi:hypothetical protein